MPTALDLITNAMIEIGAADPNQAITAAEGAFGLSKLNRMLDSWNTRRLFVYLVAHNVYTFPVSKQAYTIGRGAGADFVTERPVKVESASLILSGVAPQTHMPLYLLTADEYEAIALPALSSTMPTQLYYDPTYPNGTLYPWPYPTDLTNTLELSTWLPLSAIAALYDVIALPPGYEEALTMSLAERLCTGYGRPLTGELAEQARKARTNIQGVNRPSVRMTTDLPIEGSGYFDYLTGIR